MKKIVFIAICLCAPAVLTGPARASGLSLRDDASSQDSCSAKSDSCAAPVLPGFKIRALPPVKPAISPATTPRHPAATASTPRAPQAARQPVIPQLREKAPAPPVKTLAIAAAAALIAGAAFILRNKL